MPTKTMKQELQKSGTNTAMAIVKYKPADLCTALTADERSMILASNSPKVKELQPMELEVSILGCLTKAWMVLGHNKGKGDDKALQAEQAIIAGMICEDLLRKFPNITLADFEMAMLNGSRGEYTAEGGVTYVSVSSVYQWVRTYCDIKRYAIKQQHDFEQRKQPLTPTLTPEQAQAEMNQWCIMAFSQFKDTGEYFDLGNSVYDHLVKLGKVALTEKQKNEIRAQAKQKILHETKCHRPFDVNERDASKQRIWDIDNETKVGKNIISAEAKRIALCNIFADLIKMDMNITDLMELNIDKTS